MDPQKAQQSKAAATSAKDAPAGSAGNKKKQGASTAQGRKIARKTAHSLIERRRRSKINEEFGILKEMIPGCEGQDMHKLSILQASIEYMRYLEKVSTCMQFRLLSIFRDMLLLHNANPHILS
jgi:hypothetical protein